MLLNRDGIIHMLSDKQIAELDHIAEYFCEVIFQLGKGKTPCDLYANSENLKIEFYLLNTHFELLINKLPRIFNKGKAETK